MDTVILRLLGVFSLLAINGFFVAVEFAAVSARRSRIDQQAESGAMGARRAQRMLNDTDRVLAASQLGITMASLALGWVGEPFVADLLEPPLNSLPIGQWVSVKDVAHAASAVIAFSAITSLHIIVGEQAPKVWAIRDAERVITLASLPMIAFDRLFRPFIYVLDHATEWVLKLFGMKPISGHRVYHSVEELKQLVSDSQEGGVLEESEEEMIHNVFEFADRQVSEAMVPRPDIAGLESAATLNEFLELFAQSRYSRYPLYEGDLDNITGFVTIKDVLNFMASEGPAARQKPVAQLMRPAMHVPEFKQVGTLFEEMKTQGISLAVVVDEYGGTAGIVTQGGILEVLVGRLRDEAVSDEPEVSQLDERTAEVDAQLRIEEINEELKTSLPEHDAYETLAGLILFQLQRIPGPGERLKVGDIELTVKEMHGAKIEKVEIKRVDPPHKSEEAPSAS